MVALKVKVGLINYKNVHDVLYIVLYIIWVYHLF